MADANWDQIKTVFYEARERLEDSNFDAWLGKRCGDANVESEVRKLLEQDVRRQESNNGNGRAPKSHRSQPESALGRVGPYYLRRSLGEGAMGQVFLAEEREMKRLVAVKLIRGESASEDFVLSLENERQRLARMGHRHIAQIYHGGTTKDGLPFFAMEYVKNGLPITEYCTKHKLSLRARLEAFLQVCSAVQHAHQQRTLHCDLKPSNILVRDSDFGPDAKVIDFGIAAGHRTKGEGRLVSKHTGGTPGYMSPEQAAGKSNTEGTDVYALGVVLYELLVGSLPVACPTDAEGRERYERALKDLDPPLVSERLQEASHPDGTIASRDVQGALDSIVATALERDPERRYRSPQALAKDLQRYLNGEPVYAVPQTRVYLLQTFLRRYRRSVAWLSAAFLVISSLAAWAIWERELAVARFDDFQRLSDLKRLENAKLAAERLWPASPDQAAALKAWLNDHGEPLAATLAEHKAWREQLRTQARDADPESQVWLFDELESQWWHDTMTDLIQGLTEFTGENPHISVLASVKERLDRSESVIERTITGAEPSALWKKAIEDIRQSSVYGGLELKPQVGLLPLAKNSAGLWEFLVADTGTAPRRRVNSDVPCDWNVAKTTGVILILLPGARMVMTRETNSGREAQWVRVEPFFISKYELTHGQWYGMTGEIDKRYPPSALGWNHPRQDLTWEDSRLWLARYELRLPTEEEWEYAARAKTDTPWWSGSRASSVKGAGNVADQSARGRADTRGWNPESWTDGWVVHAPVGSFQANGFGLHDTIGNLMEWCALPYDVAAVASRDPSSAAGDELHCYLRGGSFATDAAGCRVSRRVAGTPRESAHDRGVRPARSVR